jgi:hypothetical protein
MRRQARTVEAMWVSETWTQIKSEHDTVEGHSGSRDAKTPRFERFLDCGSKMKLVCCGNTRVALLFGCLQARALERFGDV